MIDNPKPCGPAEGSANIVRIGVVDDHPMMCGGLVATLSEVTGFEVVATGGDADTAVNIALQKAPDVLIIDFDMPGGAVSVLERLRQVRSRVRVVILSVSDDFVSINTAFDAGARGYISKGVSAPELVEAVRGAMGDAPFVTALPNREDRRGTTTSLQSDERFKMLRLQEARALTAIARGESRGDAASRLGVAERRIGLLLVNVRSRIRLRQRIRTLLNALRSRR